MSSIQIKKSSPPKGMRFMVKGRDLPKHLVVPRKLLIVGCPRSGTRAISDALTTARFPVGHERCGPRGISSCFFAAKDWDYPGKHRGTPERFRFEQVWHQTRTPNKVISSMADKMPPSFWRWQEKHTGIPGNLEPTVKRCAIFWIAWNELVEKNYPGAWRYRVEDLGDLWPTMLERLGIPWVPLQTSPDHGHNERKERHYWTWDELRDALPTGIWDRLRKKAEEYGYAG